MEKHVLPSMTHTFKIQVKGQESGLNWAGEFTYRRPTLGVRSRVDVMKARLNGDMESLSHETIEFNETVSHLRFTLEKYPEWWRDTGYGIDLYDGNVIGEIYNKCMDFEKSWKTKLHGGDVNDSADADNAIEEFKDGGGEVL